MVVNTANTDVLEAIDAFNRDIVPLACFYFENTSAVSLHNSPVSICRSFFLTNVEVCMFVLKFEMQRFFAVIPWYLPRLLLSVLPFFLPSSLLGVACV